MPLFTVSYRNPMVSGPACLLLSYGVHDSVRPRIAAGNVLMSGVMSFSDSAA